MSTVVVPPRLSAAPSTSPSMAIPMNAPAGAVTSKEVAVLSIDESWDTLIVAGISV